MNTNNKQHATRISLTAHLVPLLGMAIQSWQPKSLHVTNKVGWNHTAGATQRAKNCGKFEVLLVQSLSGGRSSHSHLEGIVVVIEQIEAGHIELGLDTGRIPLSSLKVGSVDMVVQFLPVKKSKTKPMWWHMRISVGRGTNSTAQ